MGKPDNHHEREAMKLRCQLCPKTWEDDEIPNTDVAVCKSCMTMLLWKQIEMEKLEEESEAEPVH